MPAISFGMEDPDNITVAVKRQKLNHHHPAARSTPSSTKSSSNWFDKLPVEITQNIASQLEYDQDICAFQLICRSTRNAVEENGGSFWRRRFLTQFEKPHWAQADNAKFKWQYKKRRSLLKNGAVFRSGCSASERLCLEVLAELVAESYSRKSESSIYIYECKNLEHIQRFLQANNLLQIIGRIPRSSHPKDCPIYTTRKRKFSPYYHPQPAQITATTLLQAIQITAAPMLLSFDTHLFSHHYGFPDSQRAVYSSSKEMPLLHGREGLDINMPFILHNLNFWKYHMIREPETTLFYAFRDLPAHDRPQWWTAQPSRYEQNLATRWKGSYAYVERDEISAMREGHAEALEIQDHFAGEDTAYAFQDMTLELVPESEGTPWPAVFERHLHARNLRPAPPGPRTRAQKRHTTTGSAIDTTQRSLSFRIDGSGRDDSEAFLTSGYLNTLPAQQGIPGWQRVTMMKHFEDKHGNVNLEALWAYEGVLLPGGKVMVGRWWSVSAMEEEEEGEEGYSGPFILWAVE